MNKGTLSNLLRVLKLSRFLDYSRYLVQRYKNRTINSTFRKEHPEVTPPIPYV